MKKLILMSIALLTLTSNPRLASAEQLGPRNWKPLYICENGTVTIDVDVASDTVQLVLKDRGLAERFNFIPQFRSPFIFWHFPETRSSVLMYQQSDGSLTSALPRDILYLRPFRGLTLFDENGPGTRTLKWNQFGSNSMATRSGKYIFRNCNPARG
jgi:hypothetical protein